MHLPLQTPQHTIFTGGVGVGKQTWQTHRYTHLNSHFPRLLHILEWKPGQMQAGCLELFFFKFTDTDHFVNAEMSDSRFLNISKTREGYTIFEKCF